MTSHRHAAQHSHPTSCTARLPCSNLLFGIIAEFCTEQARRRPRREPEHASWALLKTELALTWPAAVQDFPVMNAGPKYEYLWADGTTIKKPISCSAPRYVDYLFTWVQNLLEDERIFPTEIGRPFPPDFLDHLRNIFKRLQLSAGSHK